ncbi:hypothetical protein DXG03_008402 [Asterophora parasitica]|uniref:Uncharacterized protein n=1 Tax=Asterophora parasitica TaxID=117018 RepID=A0A9P7GBX4_9AGAR|nr:hypothetical protein DXG03_008402 [Asterophora parasitica]
MTAGIETHGFPVGYFIVRNTATHRVLDVTGDGMEDGTEIILWSDNDTSLVESRRRPEANNQKGEISVHFNSDPAYPPPEQRLDAWKSKSYVLTSIPRRKPKTIIDDAAAFFSSAISTPLSFLSGRASAPQASPDEVFSGPIDLDENEVLEEDRTEEAEVDDSQDILRKVRMIAVVDKAESDKCLGEKAKNRRRWETQ